MFKTLLPGMLLIASVSVACASDDVPRLKVEDSCRAAATAPDNLGTSVEHCLAQEHSARLELMERWGQFDRRDQRSCTAQTNIGGLPSYVELLTCVTMARDAYRLSTEGRAAR